LALSWVFRDPIFSIHGIFRPASVAFVCRIHCFGCVQAAGTIHTDFERGFICAEVMHYDELHELGSEAAVKAAGKYRQEVCPLAAVI